MPKIAPSGKTPETESEKLFGAYLDAHGYSGWSFEPTIDDCPKHPDFLLPYNSGNLLFDVKQRAWRDHKPGARQIDAVKGIRDEIQEARKKFKNFKDFPCSLVIYNAGDPDTLLHSFFVFEAMLGEFVHVYPVSLDGTSPPYGARNEFSGRKGSMVGNRQNLDYQNRTISAILVLEKTLAPECIHAFREAIDLVHPPAVTYIHRVVVCENPGAKKRLPRELFVGRYDERWAIVDGRLGTVFSGAGVGDLELEGPTRGFADLLAAP